MRGGGRELVSNVYQGRVVRREGVLPGVTWGEGVTMVTVGCYWEGGRVGIMRRCDMCYLGRSEINPGMPLNLGLTAAAVALTCVTLLIKGFNHPS